MTIPIAIGLVLQALAVGLIAYRLRGNWLVHVGGIFVATAVVYHGINELLLWTFPGHAEYRPIVSPEYLDQFVLWIGLSIGIFAVAYLLSLRTRVGAAPSGVTDDARVGAGRWLDWRLLLVVTTPLIVLSFAGRGYGRGTVLPSAATTQPNLATGLTQQFLLTMLVLSSFAMVSRFGRKWLLLVLVAQSLLAAALGERLEILVAAGVLLYLLARVGIRIGRRQLIYGTIALGMASLILTSTRAAEGRFSNSAGGFLRLDHLIAGVRNIGSPQTRNLLVSDLGYRLDGNTFGALELQALRHGARPLGWKPLADDVELAIPSFLERAKTSSSLETRSEKVYAENHLGIRLPQVAPGVAGDILPTQLGAQMGFWGPWGLLVASAVLGVIFGMTDRWLLSRLTPARLLIGLGLLSCVLFYERSWDVYPVTFRGIIVLLVIAWALARWRERRALRAGSPIRDRDAPATT